MSHFLDSLAETTKTSLRPHALLIILIPPGARACSKLTVYTVLSDYYMQPCWTAAPAAAPSTSFEGPSATSASASTTSAATATVAVVTTAGAAAVAANRRPLVTPPMAVAGPQATPLYAAPARFAPAQMYHNPAAAVCIPPTVSPTCYLLPGTRAGACCVSVITELPN